MLSQPRICQITANSCQFCHQIASFALFKQVLGALGEDNSRDSSGTLLMPGHTTGRSNNHLPANVVAPSLLETDHY